MEVGTLSSPGSSSADDEASPARSEPGGTRKRRRDEDEDYVGPAALSPFHEAKVRNNDKKKTAAKKPRLCCVSVDGDGGGPCTNVVAKRYGRMCEKHSARGNSKQACNRRAKKTAISEQEAEGLGEGRDGRLGRRTSGRDTMSSEERAANFVAKRIWLKFLKQAKKGPLKAEVGREGDGARLVFLSELLETSVVEAGQDPLVADALLRVVSQARDKMLNDFVSLLGLPPLPPAMSPTQAGGGHNVFPTQGNDGRDAVTADPNDSSGLLNPPVKANTGHDLKRKGKRKMELDEDKEEEEDEDDLVVLSAAWKYPCPVCGPNRLFLSAEHVEKHLRASHGQGSSSADAKGKAVVGPACLDCGATFALEGDLKEHMNSVHSQKAVSSGAGQKEQERRKGGGAVTTNGVPSPRQGQPKSNGVSAPATAKQNEKQLAHARIARYQDHAVDAAGEPSCSHAQPWVPNPELQRWEGPRLQCRPTNLELLEIAKKTCCRDRLVASIESKYAKAPARLALKAAHLCSEAHIEIKWHQQGFVCHNNCKQALASAWWSSSSRVDSAGPSGGGDRGASGVSTSGGQEEMKQLENGTYVLCEDISQGLEPVPVAVVIDPDVMRPCSCQQCIDRGPDKSRPWDMFTYITSRRFDPSLGIDTRSSQLGCTCAGPLCKPSECFHVKLFDEDNGDAEDIYGNPMTGRFPYDQHGRVILDSSYIVYECNSLCQCSSKCANRVLQKGLQVKLQVFKTHHKGWAVRAGQRIPKGTFVCEYLGEVVSDSEAEIRGKGYDEVGRSYLFDIDIHIDRRRPRNAAKPLVIDATKFGNVARFLNHSCMPNIINHQVLVDSMDCQLAHIGLFAGRDIEEGEELCYDYHYKLLPGKGCRCHCGAKKCRGRLY